jgi:hypothetical protein
VNAQSGQAEAEARQSPEYRPEREVRLAVVMYGGVSLAIYMYGVARELLSLVRATAPARRYEAGAKDRRARPDFRNQSGLPQARPARGRERAGSRGSERPTPAPTQAVRSPKTVAIRNVFVTHYVQ